MRSRLVQGLITLTLILILFGVADETQACCGEAPNYYFTVSVVGQPICDYRRSTGRVDWSAQYNLPTAHNVFVYSYGDGVTQGNDYYDQLPQTPGYQYDTFSDHTNWTWTPPHLPSGSYKVRVEFRVTLPLSNKMDWALIVFDCTSRGVQNLQVHNGELEPDP